MLLFQHITGTEGQAWPSRLPKLFLTWHPKEERAGLHLAAAALWPSTSPGQSSLQACRTCSHVCPPDMMNALQHHLHCVFLAPRNDTAFTFSPAWLSSPSVPWTALKDIPELLSAKGHQGR